MLYGIEIVSDVEGWYTFLFFHERTTIVARSLYGMHEVIENQCAYIIIRLKGRIGVCTNNKFYWGLIFKFPSYVYFSLLTQMGLP